MNPETETRNSSPQAETVPIFDPAVLAQLGDFRMQVRNLTAGRTFGLHQSLRTGISTEFQDHRPWEAGSDPRFIDWRVFARTGKFFQRRFREETNSVFYFLNDFSSSMEYAPQKRLSKLGYARCVTALMAYVALQQRDSVGLSAMNGSSTVSLKPSTGESHWSECLKFLEKPPFLPNRKPFMSAQQSFAEVLNELAASGTTRGKIFLLSDFFDVEAWEAILPQMKLLAAQGNEMTLFQVLDPDEREFPFETLRQFVSLESPNERLTLSPSDVRKEYLQELEAWQKSLADGCRTLGITFVPVDSSKPVHQTILEGTSPNG